MSEDTTPTTSKAASSKTYSNSKIQQQQQLQQQQQQPKTSQQKTSQKSVKHNANFKCDICHIQCKSKKALNHHRYIQHAKKMRGIKKKKNNLMDDQLRTEITRIKVIDALKKCEEGEELEILLRAIQPNPQDMFFICEKVKKDIALIITEMFPNHVIYLFGSAVSGLMFKDSDFDFFVDVNNYWNNDIPGLIRLLYQEMCKSNKFSRIIPILSAKIPLLKCIHGVTGYNCDINFSNCMGVFNSRFLRTVMNYDYRIHPLMVVIKYWAQCRGFSGTGKITNYALTLMIMFYLQTLDEPIMPSVSKFQLDIPEFMINEWNLAFNTVLKNDMKCNKTITELLSGFFQYYHNFKFESDIICPLYGKIYKRSDFLVTENIPIEFKRYTDFVKRNPDNYQFNLTTEMCVQDPFSLSHNVASSCGQLNLYKFKSCLEHAVEICNQLSDDKVKSSKLLIQLISEEPPSHLSKVTAYKGVLSKSTLIDKRRYILCKLTPLEYDINILKNLQIKSDDESMDNNSLLTLKQQWVDYVIKFTIDMLKNIFLVKLDEFPNDDKDADVVAEINDDYVSLFKIDKTLKAEYRQLFQCKTSIDVWSNRKHGNALLKSFLTDEMNISKKKYADKKNNILLHCTLLLTTSKNYDYVEIHFYDKQINKSGMKNFFNGISTNVRNYIKGYFTQLKLKNESNSSKPHSSVSSSSSSSSSSTT